MLKIAYITERDLTSKKVSGAITRDLRLLNVLKEFSDVKVYFNNPTKYHKYLYIINNNNQNINLFNKIDSKKYDLVIISTFPISPFLNGYKKIKTDKIFYFADSAYHFRTQKQSMKYKIISHMLSYKERNILKNEYCAYLGKDEIRHIPKIYHKNCLIFPFYINKNKNVFNNSGKFIIVGDYNFMPNYKMLENINNIADEIKNNIYIYGKNIPKLDFKSNIKIIGYAETLDEIYTNVKALLYAIDYGTGIKNKVLEAMSYGIPTIGFDKAFTNLQLEDMKNCIVIESIEDLVISCNSVNLSDMSKNVYLHSIDGFSLNTVRKIIINEIRKVLDDKKNI